MWTGWVTLALAGSCGLYAMQEHNDDQTLALAGNGAALASSMAVYRDAVVRYAHEHPAFAGTVPKAQLSLPTWYADPDPGLWSNHVDAGGVIAVYATRLPAVDIAADLAQLAHGSELAGRANPGAGRIDPAAHAGAAVALPAIPNGALTAGAPVWLAHRY